MVPKMIFVKFDEANNVVAAISLQEWSKLDASDQDAYQSRHDWTNFSVVERVAGRLSAFTGDRWVPCDKGSGVYPRFDVVQVPKVGDPVSAAFNGDYRPCGFVQKVTDKLQVTTTTGHKFRRVKATAAWRMCNGSECLVGGHIDRTNPHF
jgi:hypothetical protein